MQRFLTLVFLSIWWAPSLPGQIAPEMQRASEAAKERRWSDVITLTNSLVKREPRNVQVLLVRTLAFIESSRFQDALTASSRVLSVDSLLPQAWSLHAESLIRLQRYDSAMTVLNRAIVRLPQRSEFPMQLASLLMNVGRYEAAITPLEDLAFRRPDDVNVTIQLAFCYRKIGRLYEAHDLYRRVLDVRPGDARILATLGDIHTERKEWDDAIERYRAAVNADATLEAPYLALAAALTTRDRHRESADLMRQFTLRFPGNADGWYNLGTALYRLGRFDSATRALRQAVAIRPAFAEALFNMGLALDKAGFSEEAVQALQRAASANAGLAPAAYNAMAISYRSNSRIEEALEAHRQAVMLNDSASYLHAELAYSLYMAKRFEESYAYLSEQQQRFSEDPAIALGLGRACIRTGRREQAQILVEMLQMTQPAYAEELRTMMK